MYRSLPHVLAQAILRHIGTALALVLLAAPLAACNDRATTTLERAAFVHTEIVRPQDGQGSLTLTGEVQARFRADLSFRSALWTGLGMRGSRCETVHQSE